MRVALGVFLAVSAFGQAQTIEYSVHGTVRDAVSREPVKNALVTLAEIPTPSAAAGQPQTRAMLTGPAGEFQFQGLSKGEYVYSVGKPGYAGGYDSESVQLFTIPRTPEGSSIEVNLTPLAAIEGKVVDQQDEPLENVALNIYRLPIFDGERRAINVQTVWTDDLGAFHLAYLNPGKYYVKAQGRRGGTETHFGTQAMRYAPWEAFAPVYFGGGSEISSATPITLTAGARARADFRLEMQPSFRIRGKVHGATASGTVTFEFMQNGDRAEPSRALLDTSTGEFQILDVTPGNYTLQANAEQEKMRGEAKIHVAGDVSGVTIALLPPVTLTGFVRSVGGVEGMHTGSSCQITLVGKESPDSYVSSQAGKGQLQVPDVFPGEYEVRFLCFGGYPQSASFGDVDLLKNPAVRISADAAPPPIEVEFKPGGGMLKVKFAGEVPSHSAVLLVPEFSPATGPRLQRNPTAERGGMQPTETMIGHLAPGDYTVYGLSRYEDAEFRNPEFLRTLAPGTSVHIEDGKTAEITLASLCQ